jgi:uncharacterized membrane protein
MTFTTPTALLLLLLLPVFIYTGWPRMAFRRQRDALSLALRLFIVTLLVLGMAGIHITRAANKLAVVFLVDVSDSMDSSAQAAALDYVREAMADSGTNDSTAVILFGGNALVERPMLTGTELGTIGSTPSTLNTDLAEAIRLGTALFPSDAAKRMVILSDGVVTVGDAQAAARLAETSGVQISFVPFQRQESSEVAVTNVQVPSRLNVDEPFEINYTVKSEIVTDAVVTLLANGQTLARALVNLRVGNNPYFFRLNSGFGRTGFGDLRIQVEPVDSAVDGFYQNNQLSAFTEITGPSRVLVVARDGEDGQLDIEYLRPALEEVGLAIDVMTPDQLPIGLAPLTTYASVVLVNVPAAQLSPMRMEILRTYVRDLGGGLVVIGGDSSYGVGGYYRTPIEDILPVEMQLRDQERIPALSIYFVIDTSGSMGIVAPSGFEKIALAREAIIRSIDLLNPVDTVGVVGFSSSASWVVTPTQAENPVQIIERVGTLRAGGGTDILAGLRAVADYMPTDNSQLKHIILLTDGGDNPQGIPEIVEHMNINYNASTTVVAIGDGFAPFLQDVAAVGRGNFHFARDVSTIPSIFTAETVLASRSYIMEEDFFPALSGSSPILTGIRRVPQLHGYVASTAKDTAQVLLRSPVPNSDPILAAWQFGLGRSVAWTSDATSRWASDWVDWESFPRFFSQMVRWTITEGIQTNLETRVEQRGEEAVLVVDARDNLGNFLNGLILQATIVGPTLENQTTPLPQVSPGRYEGVFEPGQEGAYWILVSGQPTMVESGLPADARIAQRAGWVLTYSPEYLLPEDGVDLELLNDLANLTGGESLAGRPDAVFEHNLRATRGATPIWPWLLLLAALLMPFDVGVRRLVVSVADLRKAVAWAMARLGLQTVVTRKPRSESLDRLMAARERARGDLSRLDSAPPEVSAVDAVLPTDERKAPTPARPVATGSTAGRTAASLAARKRTGRPEPQEVPEPLPQAVDTHEKRPPQPEPPRIRPKPERQPDESTTASRLLKRKRQRQDQTDDEL